MRRTRSRFLQPFALHLVLLFNARTLLSLSLLSLTLTRLSFSSPTSACSSSSCLLARTGLCLVCSILLQLPVCMTMQATRVCARVWLSIWGRFCLTLEKNAAITCSPVTFHTVFTVFCASRSCSKHDFQILRATCKHVHLKHVLEPDAAQTLKTVWKVTGARFSRQSRCEPLPDVYSLVFSSSLFYHGGVILHLLFCLCLRLCTIFSLLLVFGWSCTYPSIHFHCLAGVTSTKLADMLDSLVRDSRLGQQDHVAKNQSP